MILPVRAAQNSPFLRLWGWPLLLGLLTISGLGTALVSDTWGDVWSWLALGVPVIVMVWHGLRRPKRGQLQAASATSSSRAA